MAHPPPTHLTCLHQSSSPGHGSDADDATAFAVQELLAMRYAAASADRTAREPGEPGVRLRCFLELRQEPGS
ncbi:DUF6207 family protein [Streptomyces sp. URMC 128]|uniref:DUF6207 family protein n=1 Tax=Streptomyces sp. URMC 128 TaxID=3423404 RepID=UPI003F1B75A1